jgi:anaerobic selenocysteine-containing dehydrogenase
MATLEDDVGTTRPATTTGITYCRICSGFCGLVVEVEAGRVVRARGDRQNALTGGFTCVKGRRIGDFASDPARYRECRRRGADGELEPVDPETAMREVGERLRELVERHGPDSVALYWGTHGAMTIATKPWAQAFWRALGSRKWFSTMTVDQAPKWVTPGRLGVWLGGRQRFEDSDVWLFIGFNPLVSMLGGIVTGFPQTNGPKRLRDAKKRGLKTIVIDPRRSETAASADVHLQLIPGSDAVLLAGLLRVILEEGLEDADFCARWVEDLAALREAVAFATPELVARAAGVDAGDVVAAARLFAGGRRGMVSTGTGANMGPTSNLVEHLAMCLNVVCGRFAREGELAFPPTVLAPAQSPRAQVAPPDRSWERGYRSRFGYGLVFGELPTITIPDEILDPAPDRVRALIVIGGNPASSIPDQERTVRAFRELELLVTLEPFPTETARLSHYVLAPALAIERPEHTGPLEYHVGAPFAQYAAPVVPAPPGVREDWQYLAGVAAAMGLTLEVAGRTYGPDDPRPTSDEFLEQLAEHGRVPLDEVKRHPHGRMYEELEQTRVLPPDDESGRFRLVADDVADELAAVGEAAASDEQRRRPFVFAVRRMKETMNSSGRRLPGLAKHPYNPAFVNPDDLERLGVRDGDLVRIESDEGSVVAVAEADPRLRRGVVSMTHGYGDLPGEDDDPRRFGANPARLLGSDRVQPIVGMPWMTAVPVSLERV